ncbi:unnamed protein product [Timema podura]|uniref:Uncharacterized protein n=1 Tax=Timema podura TaxID=61482 RepID=A0ABN7PN45_TIMPD|nr:unnamed protein product [Timema podura]
MVRAVTWRYMAPHLPDYAPLCCFYGGELLDEFLHLVTLTQVDPKALGLNYLYNDMSQSTVGRLTRISRKFMNFFEKNTEKILNTHYTVSGAKIMDILDCVLDGKLEREFQLDPSREDYCVVRSTYLLPRSWFTCLPVSTGASPNWAEEQRYMYLRLRRLVCNYNEHVLQQLHHDRECLLRTSDSGPPPPRLIPSSYSGYGEYKGRFFFYGNMNQSSYALKFLHLYPPGDADDTSSDEGGEERPSEGAAMADVGPVDMDLLIRLLGVDTTTRLQTFNSSHRSLVFESKGHHVSVWNCSAPWTSPPSMCARNCPTLASKPGTTR